MKTARVLPVWLALVASAHAVVTLEWVTVGDPGNAADSTGFGSVGYTYQIMKYEVTNAQYAEFLNAKAASDPNDLYSFPMGTSEIGGITQSGTSGSYTYSVKSGYENMPVVNVSHLDAQRFANWIHNGQGSGSTETGAYTVGTFAIHNTNAAVWLPTEDEWYKAAYYDPSASGPVADDYWLYATRSDAAPSAAPPSGAANSANYFNANPTPGSPSGTNFLSNVGAYTGSSSYYGTFDQSGNVWEWTDGLILPGGSRVSRGGSWGDVSLMLESSAVFGSIPFDSDGMRGFRLASSSVPEPSRALLLLVGAGAMLMRRRRLPFAL